MGQFAFGLQRRHKAASPDKRTFQTGTLKVASSTVNSVALACSGVQAHLRGNKYIYSFNFFFFLPGSGRAKIQKAAFSHRLLSHTTTSPECEYRVCGRLDSGWNKTDEENFIKLELEVKAAARPTKILHIAPDSVVLGQYSNRAVKQTVLRKGSSEKVSSSSLPLGRRSYTAVTSCQSERWVAALCKLAFVCPFFFPGLHPMDSAISTTASLIKHLRNSELICNIESVLE